MHVYNISIYLSLYIYIYIIYILTIYVPLFICNMYIDVYKIRYIRLAIHVKTNVLSKSFYPIIEYEAVESLK